MKKLIPGIIIFIFLILSSISSYSQEKIIHGQVFTFDSIPLINASIKVKSTKQVVVSDTTGRFSVACDNKDVLTVFAEGFNKQKVKLKGTEKLVIINLNLKPGEKNKEIAIGYGHIADKDLLYSVAKMESNDNDFSKYTNMFELIQGKLPGVQVYNGEVIIRGVNSINNNAALIVIDGVPAESSILGSIPPSQVKNVSVLKDGNTAIYGLRGANGVVIIETKGGRED